MTGRSKLVRLVTLSGVGTPDRFWGRASGCPMTLLNWTADGHGNEVKVLRTNPETGFMHLLVKARAEQTNSPRSFLGPAETPILEGAIDINGSTVRAAA